MTIYSGLRGSSGSASGFTLGSPDNLFGSTTSDASSSLIIQSASSRIVAEATRDSYFTNNPSHLIQYSNNNLLGILLYYLDESDTVLLPQTYLAGVWVDSKSFVAVQGASGAAATLQNVSEGHVPVKLSNNTFGDSGALVDNGRFTIPTELQVGLSTILFGEDGEEIHALSSGGENLIFANRVSDDPYTPAGWANGSKGTPWTPFHRRGGTLNSDMVIQSDTSSVITNPSFTTPLSGNRRDYTITINAVSPQTNCIFKILQNGEAIFRCRDFNIVAGDNIIDLRVSNDAAGFVDLKQGTSYTVEILSDDGDVVLRGSSSGIPYLKVTYQEWQDVPMLLEGDLDNLFEYVTRERGYLRFTQHDGEVSKVSVSNYDRVYRNLGQGVNSGSASINLLESAWVDLHPDAMNFSRLYLPSYTNIDSDESFVIDAARVTEDITFDIEIPNTQFRDGTTSTTIRAGHVVTGWAHLDNTSLPKSSTNILRLYITQTPADGDMGQIFHPEMNNTVILSQNGDNTNSGRTIPEAVQTATNGLQKLSTLSGSSHKQLLIFEETTIGAINNNATGGANVSNLAINAPETTINSFSSIGHACRLNIRRLDLPTSTDTCVVSHNDDLEIDVITGITGRQVTFDTSVIGHAKINVGTVGVEVTFNFSNLASMAAGDLLRLEVDRYENNPITALNTLPDVPLFIEGWLDNISIKSDSNGKVWGSVIGTDGAIVTTAYNNPPI